MRRGSLFSLKGKEEESFVVRGGCKGRLFRMGSTWIHFLEWCKGGIKKGESENVGESQTIFILLISYSQNNPPGKAVSIPVLQRWGNEIENFCHSSLVTQLVSRSQDLNLVITPKLLHLPQYHVTNTLNILLC